MADGPDWVELTKAVGEINARLIAGELENEDIRTHLEMEPAAWFYGAEDPNKLVTVYVLVEDLERAERTLAEPGHGPEEAGFPAADEPDYDILAERDHGLRSRTLRWFIAAVVAGALLFGYVEGYVRDLLR